MLNSVKEEREEILKAYDIDISIFKRHSDMNEFYWKTMKNTYKKLKRHFREKTCSFIKNEFYLESIDELDDALFKITSSNGQRLRKRLFVENKSSFDSSTWFDCNLEYTTWLFQHGMVLRPECVGFTLAFKTGSTPDMGFDM